MNPTTPQPNSQQQNSGQPIAPDALSASLAFATHLHEQSLPKETPQAPQEAQNGQGQPQGQETGNVPDDTKMTDMEAKIDKKLEVLRDELKGSQKVEIESLRKDIKDALDSYE